MTWSKSGPKGLMDPLIKVLILPKVFFYDILILKGLNMNYLVSVDCVLEEWSSWSSCSKSCNEGFRGRTRNILQQAEGGGLPCVDRHDVQSCNSGHCPGAKTGSEKQDLNISYISLG